MVLDVRRLRLLREVARRGSLTAADDVLTLGARLQIAAPLELEQVALGAQHRPGLEPLAKLRSSHAAQRASAPPREPQRSAPPA
jgi:hypothetical protein